MSERRADVAVVGAGIVGLAHAWAAASNGAKVVLFERGERSAGASIRNFGLIWPVGQPAGAALEMALESRRIWREILDAARIPYFDTGSLHLTYREDEQAVAEEFAAVAPSLGYQCAWISAAETLRRSPMAVPGGLRGALWSATELTVDPRMTTGSLPAFLAERLGVELRFGHAVRSVDLPAVRTAEETWMVDRVIVCAGDDFETLYPERFRESGLVRCKLQMMRTAPQPEGFSLGPALAAGLTLRFYPSFRVCSTLGAYGRRVAQETPEFDRWGIHVMVSQTPGRELTIGDSHEYGNHVDIFNRDEIDASILGYLRTFARPPVDAIAQRWYGVYAKHPTQPFLRFDPAPGVTVVTGLGGAGMTLSFGLAANTWRRMAG